MHRVPGDQRAAGAPVARGDPHGCIGVGRRHGRAGEVDRLRRAWSEAHRPGA